MLPGIKLPGFMLPGITLPGIMLPGIILPGFIFLARSGRIKAALNVEVAQHIGDRWSPLIIGHAEGAIRKSPMFVRHDRSAPFMRYVQIVCCGATLNRAAIMPIAAAHQVALIRR